MGLCTAQLPKHILRSEVIITAAGIAFFDRPISLISPRGDQPLSVRLFLACHSRTRWPQCPSSNPQMPDFSPMFSNSYAR